MTFLAPLFLLAAAAIVVPLLLHLRQRKTQERLAFPSLMFLEEVPHATIRRRRLRDLLLLLLRSLAVLLLVLAFAQPALRSRLGGGSQPVKELFVLVDRSASMAIDDRWDRAQSMVAEQVQGLNSVDRVTLALFDEAVELPLVSSVEHGQVARVLGEAEPRDRRTALAAGLRVVGPMILDLLSKSDDTTEVEVLLVSDFPRNGADGLEQLRLPAGVGLELMSVAEQGRVPNRWVRDIEIQRGIEPPSGSQRELVRVAATIGSDEFFAGNESGAESSTQVTATLLLDGREVEEQTVTLDGRSTSVGFRPVALESGRVSRGEVRLDSDRFPKDDAYFFTASASDALRVLLVDGGRGSSPLYVERALGSLKSPRYTVGRNRGGTVTLSDLDAVHVAVVLDAGSLSDADLAGLESFVQRGGGLLLAYGRASIAKPMVHQFDLRSGAEVQQSRSGVRISSVSASHPALAPLLGGDWNTAPFFRHFPLKDPSQSDILSADVTPENAGITALARFDNGDVALAEYSLERGRIVAFASTLDTSWNEFPRQAVFLGWLDQTLQYLGRFVPTSESYTVGQPALVEAADESQEDWVLTAASGQARNLARSSEGGTQESLLLSFDEAGHSSLRPQASDVSVASWYAANLDRRESELVPADLDVVRAQLTPESETRVATSGVSAAEPVTSFWWLVLYAVLLLLVSEGVVASRVRSARHLLAR